MRYDRRSPRNRESGLLQRLVNIPFFLSYRDVDGSVNDLLSSSPPPRAIGAAAPLPGNWCTSEASGKGGLLSGVCGVADDAAGDKENLGARDGVEEFKEAGDRDIFYGEGDFACACVGLGFDRV